MALFPITDLSRMADIRMRRRRAVLLLAAIVLLPCWWFSGEDKHRDAGGRLPANVHIDLNGLNIDARVSQAMSAVASALGDMDFDKASGGLGKPALPPRGFAWQSVPAGALSIASNCDRKLTVMPRNDGQAGEVRIYSPHSLRGVNGAPGATLSLDACSGSGDVFVEVPASMPMAFNLTGDGRVTLGRFTGDQTINATGDGTIGIAGARNLALSVGGDAKVQIGILDGEARITKHGDGELSVGDAKGAVQIDTQGDGDISFGVVGAPISVRMHGDGDVRLGTLSASGRFDIVGDGDLHLGLVHVDDLGITMDGAGSLRVGAGSIGHLDATLAGSVDGEVGAQVATARQQIGADASLKLPAANGGGLMAPLPPLSPLAPLAPLPPAAPG